MRASCGCICCCCCSSVVPAPVPVPAAADDGCTGSGVAAVDGGDGGIGGGAALRLESRGAAGEVDVEGRCVGDVLRALLGDGPDGAATAASWCLRFVPAAMTTRRRGTEGNTEVTRGLLPAAWPLSLTCRREARVRRGGFDRGPEMIVWLEVADLFRSTNTSQKGGDARNRTRSNGQRRLGIDTGRSFRRWRGK